MMMLFMLFKNKWCTQWQWMVAQRKEEKEEKAKQKQKEQGYQSIINDMGNGQGKGNQWAKGKGPLNVWWWIKQNGKAVCPLLFLVIDWLHGTTLLHTFFSFSPFFVLLHRSISYFSFFVVSLTLMVVGFCCLLLCDDAGLPCFLICLCIAKFCVHVMPYHIQLRMRSLSRSFIISSRPPFFSLPLFHNACSMRVPLVCPCCPCFFL